MNKNKPSEAPIKAEPESFLGDVTPPEEKAIAAEGAPSALEEDSLAIRQGAEGEETDGVPAAPPPVPQPLTLDEHADMMLATAAQRDPRATPYTHETQCREALRRATKRKLGE